MNNNDNQHGMCCECPSKHDGSRMLTMWESSRMYHTKLAKYTNTFNNSNLFRKTLSQNPQVVDMFNEQYLKPTTCKNSPTTVYSQDTSNYHEIFNKEILREMQIPQNISGNTEKIYSTP